MSVHERLTNFQDLRDQYLLPAAPGIAFHGMLFPGRYPTERSAIKARLNNPSLPSPILEKYRPETLPFIASGMLIQRLAILYGPSDEPNYDPEYVMLLQREYAQLQSQEIEEVRVAWHGLFLAGMKKACGETSPFVETYIQGIRDDNPKCSFWTAYPLLLNSKETDWYQPSSIGMQYYMNQRFAGNTVSVTPFSDHLAAFMYYCRSVFESATQSTNITNVNLSA